jgi:hypothetical protein
MAGFTRAFSEFPDGGHGMTLSISPQLSVRRGREAVDFYIAAFGARLSRKNPLHPFWCCSYVQHR